MKMNSLKTSKSHGIDSMKEADITRCADSVMPLESIVQDKKISFSITGIR
jgi:hypothetical protein